MARIFVSYSRADAKFVRDFVLMLREVYRRQHEVWYDREIHGGKDWWRTILAEIARADLVIYVISHESLASSYCQAEFAEAQRLQLPILPVVIRRISWNQVPADHAEAVKRIQWVEMLGGVEDSVGVIELMKALNELLTAEYESHEPRSKIPTPEPPVQDKLSATQLSSQTDLIELSLSRPPTPTRRGWLLGVGLVTLVMGLIAGYVYLLGAGDTAESPGATHESADASETQAADETEIAAAPTDTETPVNETLTETTVPKDEPQPESNSSIPPGFPGNAVTRNEEWEPVIQTIDDIEMVLVPAGCFMMGSESGQDDEQPINRQCFEAPFWIDRYEVTNVQFAVFDGQAEQDSFWKEEDRPRENITWLEARDFCEKRGARLPTEREWEYVARGASNYFYPWGNTFVDANSVWNRSRSEGTAPVGTIEAGVSWVGAYDMSGNVWEYTGTLFQTYPYEDSEDSRDGYVVMRGGSWESNPNDLRAADRYTGNPNERRITIGFRCVRDYE